MTDDRRGVYIPQDWLGQDLSGDELLLLARLDSYWRSYRVAYPSDQFLAQQLGFHPRKIQRLMVSLSEKGWIRRVGSYSQSRRGGQYREVHPTERSRPSPQEVIDNSVDRVPDTSVDWVVDKSVEGEKQRESKRERTHGARVNGHGSRTSLPCPEGVSPEVWADYLRHRKNLRAPLTETAWKRMAPELEQAAREGWNRDDALAEAMAAGWRGLKAEWLRNRQPSTPAGDDTDPKRLPPDEEGRAPWLPNGKPNPEYRGGTYWP